MDPATIAAIAQVALQFLQGGEQPTLQAPGLTRASDIGALPFQLPQLTGVAGLGMGLLQHPAVQRLLAERLGGPGPEPRVELAGGDGLDAARRRLRQPAALLERGKTPTKGAGESGASVAGGGPAGPGAFQAALQNPVIQALLLEQLQGRQPPAIQAPGLLQPSPQGPAFQLPPLSAMPGLFGGGG